MVTIDNSALNRRVGRSSGRCSFKRITCYVVVCGVCLFLGLLASLLVVDLNAPSSTEHWSHMEPASMTRLRPKRLQPNARQNEQAPDAYFNGFPLYLRQDQDDDDPAHSHVHCVGENFHADSWMQRSCQFSMLCFDLTQHDFVIFQSYADAVLNRFLNSRPDMDSSTAMFKGPNATTSVSVGGINLKWSLKTDNLPTSSENIKWFPRVLNATNSLTYYELPSNVVMIPYHSLAGMNPGHLVWDDFLPIYTLLTMFQMQNRELLLLRMLLPQKLWSSCEASEENERHCQKMTNKFLPLLVGKDYPYNTTTTTNVQFVIANTNHHEPQSNFVCAPRGAAGLAPLTDHGIHKAHGWMRNDYERTHNHGRGPMLYEFRNFMLSNIGIPVALANPRPPFKVAFSLSSSDIPSRVLDFQHQIQTLQQNFPPEMLDVEAFTMKDLTMEQQMQLASQTSIFITICGGGAVNGMFLPKGASVFLYYLAHGGVEYGVHTHLPAQLDWDLFNNLSHLRVHWLPTSTMDQTVDLRALVLLVRHELQLIQSQALL